MQCKECAYDLYLNPVPCNGVIIENEKGEILLVKRKYNPQKGFWDVPGGFARRRESFEESVKREVKEELGVEVEVGKIVGIYTDDYLYQGVVNVTFCVMAAGKITGGTLIAADDVEEWRYFKKEEIAGLDIAFAGMRKAIEEYIRIIK